MEPVARTVSFGEEIAKEADDFLTSGDLTMDDINQLSTGGPSDNTGFDTNMLNGSGDIHDDTEFSKPSQYSADFSPPASPESPGSDIFVSPLPKISPTRSPSKTPDRSPARAPAPAKPAATTKPAPPARVPSRTGTTAGRTSSGGLPRVATLASKSSTNSRDSTTASAPARSRTLGSSASAVRRTPSSTGTRTSPGDSAGPPKRAPSANARATGNTKIPRVAMMAARTETTKPERAPIKRTPTGYPRPNSSSSGSAALAAAGARGGPNRTNSGTRAAAGGGAPVRGGSMPEDIPRLGTRASGNLSGKIPAIDSDSDFDADGAPARQQLEEALGELKAVKKELGLEEGDGTPTHLKLDDEDDDGFGAPAEKKDDDDDDILGDDAEKKADDDDEDAEKKADDDEDAVSPKEGGPISDDLSFVNDTPTAGGATEIESPKAYEVAEDAYKPMSMDHARPPIADTWEAEPHYEKKAKQGCACSIM